MNHTERRDDETFSPRRLRFTKPSIHDNGPIVVRTAGDDDVGEQEGDTWYCRTDAVPQERE